MKFSWRQIPVAAWLATAVLAGAQSTPPLPPPPAPAPVRGRACAQPRTAAGAAPGRRRLDRHAGARGAERGGDQDRFHARLRYRVEHLLAGHRLRDRRRARPDPHQPPRGDAGAGDRRGHLPQSRGSAAVSDIPRSGARLRPVSLRPGQAALHQAAVAAAVSGRRADRARDPRDRQQRRASSCPSSPARWRAWTARHRITAPVATTTSTPSTCRPRRAPRVVPPVRRWSTTAAASSR